MGRRTRTRVALALWALAAGGTSRTPVLSSAEHGSSSWLGGCGVLSARAQTVDGTTGRWAQASALLSPADDPTLLIISGKAAVAGQTVDSAPSTSSALSLNLSQPILDLDHPPWASLDSTGPIASYASLVPLSSSAALFFGGDASSDPAVAVQTGNDSSWILDLALPSSSAASSTTSAILVPSWSHETAAQWPSQPQRSELAFTASATNGTLSRAWLYGGQRPDGSGTTFAELWELEVTLGRDGALDSPRWAAWEADQGADVPPPMYDGAAVLVPSAKTTDLPSVYLVGGAQVDEGTASLVDLSSVWAFTPDSTLGGGSWALVETSGTAPPARRGHVAVEVGGGRVWIQGGRSLDGTTVLGDAWVLDTRRKRWTEARKGAQVWGHSAAMVGETVVLTFGYGVNAPASTALTVYAPGNNTWLDAYYPSYAVVVSNPKAGGSSSPSSAADPVAPSTTAGADGSPAATATLSPADPAATGSSPTNTGNGHSSSSNDDSPPAPAWTAPGSAGTSPDSVDGSSSSPDGTSSDGGSSSDGDAPSKSTIAGAVVGSLLGALAVVAGAAFAVRRHRDAQSGARRYAGAGFTGDDDEFGRPGGLMAEHRVQGGYASSVAYNLDKVHPAAAAAAGGGVLGALAGLLSPRDKFASGAAAGRKRRFDILKDEENDEAAWDGRKEGWTRFDDEGEDDVRDEAGAALGGGRGGMGIWEGFGGVSGGIDRLSDSLKSSSSYLGGALGGFIGASATATSRSGSRRRRSGGGLVGDDDEDRFADSEPVQRVPNDHAYAAVGLAGAPAGADPALAPIAEWEEEDDDEGRYGPVELRTLDTHSSGTHATGSTVPSSGADSSPAKAAAVRIVRPFSPASSLYGSAFEGHQPLYGVDPALTRTASDRSLASATNRLVQRSNSSWWSRLNLPKPAAADVSTPTAAVAIRDPAPAPSVVGLAASNPFLDPPPPPASAESADAPTSSSSHAAPPTRRPSYRVTRPDEMGRFGAGGTGHLVRGEHDSSLASTATDVTATSSVLEERLRHMDVVERIRTGSAGDSSVEVTPTLGGDGSSFGQLPSSSALDNPFADAPARPQLAYTPAQDSVIWAGSLAGALSEVGGGGSGARPSTPPPRVPSVPGILPPTPTYAPPDSPRKRLVGPRPQPMSPGGSRAAPFGTPTRSGSVKDLVASIEQRRAPPPPQPVLAPAPSSGAVARKRAKVEHGLVKKPLLYLTNPDV